MYGPVIEGQQLRLRPPRPDDAATMVGWFEDMEATRYLARRHPPSLEGEKEWLETTANDPGSVVWVIEVEGRAVGTTGIREIDWMNGFGVTGTLIGDRAVWARGIGREAMQLRTRYAFTQLPLRKLKSSYFDGNAASGRAQAAAGYREVGRYRRDRWVEGEWRDEILTEVLREDWEKSNSV
ncbi:MAG TPA: GNAT family protein [Candidatus Sulfotelmatobacter sp.]|nr:GNAT family protein [Candidatus Sulfotelmatobacter sp.]